MSDVRGIIHVVSNADVVAQFFIKVLDFSLLNVKILSEPSFDVLFKIEGSKAKFATLQLGGQFHYLIEFAQKHPDSYIPDSQSNDLWFQHIAIVVSDMKKAHAILEKNHVKPISHSPQTIPEWNQSAAGIQAHYFRSPEGHPLELIYFPKGKGEENWQKKDRLFLGIDHTAIAVYNTEESLGFYRDFLGMKVVAEGLNYGDTQELLSGVSGAKVKITNLQFPGSQGVGIELLEYLHPIAGRKKTLDMPANHPIENVTLIEVANLDRFLKKTISVVGIGEYTEGGILTDPDGHRVFLVKSSL